MPVFQARLNFKPYGWIDSQGSRVTSDGGLILVRELDERLGFGELIRQHLTDSRRGKNTQFPFHDLLRQSVYSRLAGYEDLNDADRFSQDPTFRLIGSERIWDRGAAAGEDGRPAGQTCPLLLAATGRESLTRRLFRSVLRRIELLFDSCGNPEIASAGR